MSTAVSVLGGVRRFLVGTIIMTEGVKALAGSLLRAVLSKATATTLLGVVWGSPQSERLGDFHFETAEFAGSKSISFSPAARHQNCTWTFGVYSD